jgi:hypothetical protein
VVELSDDSSSEEDGEEEEEEEEEVVVEEGGKAGEVAEAEEQKQKQQEAAGGAGDDPSLRMPTLSQLDAAVLRELPPEIRRRMVFEARLASRRVHGADWKSPPRMHTVVPLVPPRAAGRGDHENEKDRRDRGERVHEDANDADRGAGADRPSVLGARDVAGVRDALSRWWSRVAPGGTVPSEAQACTLGNVLSAFLVHRIRSSPPALDEVVVLMRFFRRHAAANTGWAPCFDRVLMDIQREVCACVGTPLAVEPLLR